MPQRKGCIPWNKGKTKENDPRIKPNKNNLKHGHSYEQEFAIWKTMQYRCNHDPLYKNRGIKVCDRWLNYENFLKDMGKRPDKTYSLERKCNEGNYEPDNVIWATTKEQSRNRRSNRLITFQDQTFCIRDWELKLGFKRNQLWDRLYRGWSIERAFTQPFKVRKN